MILMILREGLKKALLVILYFTQCKLHLPSPEMELKDAWVSLLGGRLVEQLQTKHLSLTFFYLREKELILDYISVIALGLSSGIEQSIQVDSITSKRAQFGRHILFQNSHQPCYFASIGIALIFLESGKNSIF